MTNNDDHGRLSKLQSEIDEYFWFRERDKPTTTVDDLRIQNDQLARKNAELKNSIHELTARFKALEQPFKISRNLERNRDNYKKIKLRKPRNRRNTHTIHGSEQEHL